VTNVDEVLEMVERITDKNGVIYYSFTKLCNQLNYDSNIPNKALSDDLIYIDEYGAANITKSQLTNDTACFKKDVYAKLLVKCVLNDHDYSQIKEEAQKYAAVLNVSTSATAINTETMEISSNTPVDGKTPSLKIINETDWENIANMLAEIPNLKI
jgi:hypothetical protein